MATDKRLRVLYTVCGSLWDYQTGTFLGPATAEEEAESDRAAQFDAGMGLFTGYVTEEQLAKCERVAS